MKSTQLMPAVQKAYAYIKANLDSGKWEKSGRLPGSRKLAASAGVSPVSMLKAIAKLKEDGLIAVYERGHIRLHSKTADDPVDTQQLEAVWQMKRVQVETDILEGRIASKGPLPSFKELQARYGVCYETMRKILQSLVKDKVIEIRKKRYERYGHKQGSYQQRIEYITHRTDSVQRSAINQEHKRIVDILEGECARTNRVLETIEVDFYNSAESRRAARALSGNKQAMGYVLDVWWYVTESFRQTYLEFLAALAGRKKPVALLDELGTFSLPREFSVNPLLQVFCIPGAAAGQQVAGFLLGLGHRRAVYLSTAHAHPFSQYRLEGLRARFAKAGFPDGVKAVVVNSMDPFLMQIFYAAGFKDDLIHKLLSASRTPQQLEDQFNAWLRFKDDPKPMLLSQKHAAVFRHNLANLTKLAKESIDTDFFNAMCAAALKIADDRAAAMVSEPLFEKALACKDATAWVCASDGLAFTALEFAQNRGIAVPGDISIVGFDNEPVFAAKARLTSYDFNANGFVHRMLNFISHPPRPRGAYHHSAIEVEGMVIARGSTARR
jgi:DNA-binding LacI/PurR family transcriptional regulator/DNA-binding GntR family transcriptional regulator